MNKVKIITARKSGPDITSNDIAIFYSDSGVVKAKLTGPQMDNYVTNKSYVEFPKGFKMFFYDEHMKVSSWMRANYGIRREKEKIMEAKNDVVVVNEKGEQLNAEHLIWEEEKQLIHSDKFVKITTADEIIYGDGFESNQDFTKYKIFKIRGTISLKTQKDKPL